MSWQVQIRAYGATDEIEVEGARLEDALVNAVSELGFSDNDEGSLVIEIRGEA